MTLAVVKGGQQDARPTQVIAKEANRLGFFLQKQLLGDRPEGRPVRLVLRHVCSGRVADKVDSGIIGIVTPEEIGELATRIYETASNHAEGYGRSAQRYMLQAFAEENPGEEPFSIVFQIAVQAVTAGSGAWADSDPPNETGVAQMLMRHLERREDQAGELMETAITVMAAMRAQTVELNDEIRALRRERREDFDNLEQARSDQWKRTRDDKQLEADIHVKHELIDGLKLLLPAIGRRVGLVDPNVPIKADEADFLAIINSVLGTPGQIDWLLGPDSKLSEKQKQALAIYVQFHLERDMRSQGKDPGAAQLAPAPTEPSSAGEGA